MLQLTTWTHNKILFHDDRLVNHNSKNTNKTDSKSNNNKKIRDAEIYNMYKRSEIANIQVAEE